MIVVGLTIKFWSWDFDDSFIVYRYVENILNGNGWVYNTGQNYNASTSVLNTILITCIAVFTKNIQVAAHILGFIALFLIGSSTFFLFRRDAPLWLSCLAASVITLLMGNNFTWGLESNIFYGTLLLFIALDMYGRTSWMLLGLLILLRPDALLLVGFCILRDWWRGKHQLLGIIKIAVIVLPWAVFSMIKFGQVFPATLTQKVWQGSSGFWGEGPIFLKGLINYIRGDALMHLTGVHWAPVVLVVPLVLLPQGILYLYRNSRTSILLFVLFIFAVLAAYCLLNVPNYHWYYTGFVLVVYVIAFFGFLEIHPAWIQKLSILDLPCLTLMFTLSLWCVFNVKTDFFDVRTDVYRQLSEKINAKVAPAARVAAVEVGVFGYQTKKEMIDIVGLTTPYGQFITGETNQRFFDELRPEVIILHNPLMPHEQAVFAESRFAQNYVQGDFVAFPGYPQLAFYTRENERKIAESWIGSEDNSSGVIHQTDGSMQFSTLDPWLEYHIDVEKEIVGPVFSITYDLHVAGLAAPKALFGRAYYAAEGEAFSEERAVPVLMTLGENQTSRVDFVLPGSDYLKTRRIKRMRFDPLQDLRKITVESFRLRDIRIAQLGIR